MRHPSRLTGRLPARHAVRAALLALTLALTACLPNGNEADEASDGDEASEDEETAVWPLTGLEADDPEELERPVVAVKVDNIARARPQTGVEQADLVMVAPVESATRLVALYHSTDPELVGPVRSGRLIEARMLPPFDALLVMSGAHGPVDEELRDSLPAVIAEGEGTGWRRDEERQAPHNLYVMLEDLREGTPGSPAVEQFWRFDEEAPNGGGEVSSVEIAYPQAGSSGWDWDGDAGRWLRRQDDEEHRTADGERLAADTVIVAELPTTDRERLPIDPVGEGEATVLRDGQQFEAQWRKPAAGDHMEIVTADGEPFPLKPGVTWLELLPETGAIEAQDEPAADDED